MNLVYISVSSLFIAYLLYVIFYIIRHLIRVENTIRGHNHRQELDISSNVLLVGDSYLAGVGASSNEATLSNIIAKNLNVKPGNLSMPKATLESSIKCLSGIVHKKNYEWIITNTGANDVFWMLPISTIEKRFKRLLNLASQSSQQVVVITPPKVGPAPMLVKAVLSYRFNKLVNIQRRLTQDESDIKIIDLHTDSELNRNHETYFHNDTVHLNDAGQLYLAKKIIRKINN